MTTKRKILIGLAGLAVASVVSSLVQGKKPSEIKDQLKSLGADLLSKGKEYVGLSKERVAGSTM
jgi:hypothetical protein